MFDKRLIQSLLKIPTPFYLYDSTLLKKTLADIKKHADKDWQIHFAVKANNNPRVLEIIAGADVGADCVSSHEVEAALEAGIPNDKVVFAGVGKTDPEIELALKEKIFCLNCESTEELLAIDSVAKKLGTVAPIALRINPDVSADTHKHITTGTAENKFGILESELSFILETLPKLKNTNLLGIHLHIGSQITTFDPFVKLCTKVNQLQKWFESHAISLSHINLGGGFGINYQEPDSAAVANFAEYFEIFRKNLEVRPGQTLHFEPGRAIVGQIGSLITKVTYTKKRNAKNFIIVDAGMTELMRPALYDAYHKVENLSALVNGKSEMEICDIVGPLCESTDYFAKERSIAQCSRGDLLAIRSCGAYAESFHIVSNLRPKALSFCIEDFPI